MEINNNQPNFAVENFKFPETKKKFEKSLFRNTMKRYKEK